MHRLLATALAGTAALALFATADLDARAPVKSGPHPAAGCNPPGTGITLPPGFCATIFADHLGHARHMAVSADGTLYVNTWSGRYFKGSEPPKGAFLVALKDSDGDGKANRIERFGPTAEQGNAGGDGLALWHGWVFAETNDKIVRYRLTPGHLAPTGEGEVVLSGMPLDGSHPMHPFAIDASGDLFVNMGSPSNSCQVKDRQLTSPGIDPCPQLQEHAGIWRYRADRTGQVFSPAARWATGIRNTGGITFDSHGTIYAVQHGRDQLGQNWPALYTTEQGVELPAEELIAPQAGADFGWPYCYFDPTRNRLALAPEFGGDGGKATGRCATKKGPVAAFPAHWAPNDVLAWHPGGFPSAYDNGVFIAFHGSWNRAPAPQAGYQVVFQPLSGGRPSGHWIRFADGFAGSFKEPGRAEHRPAGLAQGPDGALYIADDANGRIWRVTYHGNRAAPLAPAPMAQGPMANDKPPATTGGTASALPAGFTAADVETGQRIFTGALRGGTCSGCHGSDAHGSSAGPSLTGPTWLWADGSVDSFAAVITNGVPNPKKSDAPMPARGGTDLTPDEIRKVAAWLWTQSHSGH